MQSRKLLTLLVVCGAATPCLAQSALYSRRYSAPTRPSQTLGRIGGDNTGVRTSPLQGLAPQAPIAGVGGLAGQPGGYSHSSGGGMGAPSGYGTLGSGIGSIYRAPRAMGGGSGYTLPRIAPPTGLQGYSLPSLRAKANSREGRVAPSAAASAAPTLSSSIPLAISEPSTGSSATSSAV